MKKLTTFILVLLIAAQVFAQEDVRTQDLDNGFQTVFSRQDNLFISGFGGPIMAFTSIGNDFAHMMGGGGGIQVNNFFFGGYGVGLTTPLEYKDVSPDDNTLADYNTNLEFGHGGLWAGIIIARKKPIHLSLSSQFGWGAISQQLDGQYDLEPITSEQVFVITPILEIELNFSHFFKLGLGASTSYLRGRGIMYTPYNRADFLKPSVFLSFKFGWFN